MPYILFTNDVLLIGEPKKNVNTKTRLEEKPCGGKDMKKSVNKVLVSDIIGKLKRKRGFY